MISSHIPVAKHKVKMIFLFSETEVLTNAKEKILLVLNLPSGFVWGFFPKKIISCLAQVQTYEYISQ